jgi:glucokinase
MTTIGIDLGGTKAAAGLVGDDGVIAERVEMPTPADPARLAEVPGELINRLMRPTVGALGLGVAGLITSGGTMEFGPNLTGRHIPFREQLVKAFGLPVAVENDATVAGLAEARLGAGRGFRHVLMVTLGTGIGGGIVVDGSLYRGRSFAGEIGHMVVDPDGPRCTCGLLGCWEQLASGTALDRMARQAVEEEPEGTIARLAAGGEPDGEQVTRAAQEWDPQALQIVERLADWLGLGLANLIAVLDPEVIVIGGGLGQVGELLLGPARPATRRALTGAAYRPETPILEAMLEDPGIIGAALLAREAAR